MILFDGEGMDAGTPATPTDGGDAMGGGDDSAATAAPAEPTEETPEAPAAE
jgi:hypothetical protein